MSRGYRDGMRALIVVDVQKDFCEGGSLAVSGGANVAGDLSTYLRGDHGYSHVVTTKDHHIDPGSHFSDEPDYVDSWPVHCVVGTEGADFHDDLDTAGVEAVFHKGAYEAAYSGFEGGHHQTGELLLDWLSARGVDEVDVVGIATDYCVLATAKDAVRAGLRTRVLRDLVAGVADATSSAALVELQALGVEIADSAPA